MNSAAGNVYITVHRSVRPRILEDVVALLVERSAMVCAVDLEKFAPWMDARTRRLSAWVTGVDRENDVRLQAAAG